MLKNLIVGFSIALVLLGGFFTFINVSYAQDSVSDGLSDVQESSGLADTDIKVTIANIIRVFLGLLGIIAVCIILYGGFVWMTAGGDGEKVDKAKKILINGGIGLFIILMSYSITTFVLSAILGATNGDGPGGSGGGDSPPGFGGGSSTTFAVSAFSPDGEVEIRNIKLQITFSRNVDDDSVDGNVTISNRSTGTKIEGTLTTKGNKVSFVPSATCPEPNADRFCFDENTTFDVEVSEDIQSTAGKSLECSATNCSSSFTSGEIIDTQDPTADLSYPDDGDRISVDSSTSVQVAATDDYEVGTAEFYGAEELFDTVAAAGDDLSDVTIETTWYTDDLIEQTRYTIETIVEDIAGNTDSDSIRVLTEPEHCSNEEQDEDEEDIDCGGEDCGACDESSCTEDSDCASSTCEDGTCVSYPEISGISPSNGAIGTYVTISGEDFGTSGKVYFEDENGDALEASVPSCADWEDTQIVVEVPVGAVDGAITVTTAKGYSDSTNDDNGELIDDFDVNTTERPALCKASPDSGEIGDSITLTGANFGSSQSTSEVYFDSTEAGSYTGWANATIKLTIPAVTEDTDYEVIVMVGGVESNGLSVEVTKPETETPTISFIDPESGGIGQYVTITGFNFGAKKGSVYFEDQTSGYPALGSADFPSECDNEYWSDSQITIIVPEKYQNGDKLQNGSYDLYITTQDGTDSEPIDFSVTNTDPTPGICAIDPSSGEAGDEVVLYGERFGSSEGYVEFYKARVESVLDWAPDEVSVAVPSGTATGPLSLTSAAGEESNSVNFAVSSDDGASSSTLSGGYAWYFSTGEIPDVPELIIDCDYEAGIVSGVPNDKFTDEVCTVAVVFAKFTTLMDTDTLNSETIVIEECSDSKCSKTVEIEGGNIATSSSTTQTSFTWTWPTASGDLGFDPETTYKVTVYKEVESESGANMKKDVSWTFTTGSGADNCSLEQIVLSPQTDTITDESGTTEYQALPSGQCQVYSGASYQWDWSVDPTSYASVEEGECSSVSNDSCALATALNEGTSTVYAEEEDSKKTGDAELIVDYTDPYVTNYWPDCSTACVNASIGATFNTYMSADVTDGFSLYSCENELCVTLTDISVSGICTDQDIDSATSESICKEVQLNLTDGDGLLEADTFYRIILSGDVTSKSGVALTQTNYGSDYSWIFSTKEDETLCSIDRVDVTPDTVTLDQIGDTQSYLAEPYGEPDSCSQAGQKLNGYSYDWDWAKPYDDTNVALMIQIDGAEFDANPSGIPDGCTSICLAEGSEAYSALCGDGDIGTGEDCDDANTKDGDGCSSSCLREGLSGSYGTCGDGITDRIASTGSADQSGGEDCDDANTKDGDGCSSSCLREGSKYVGATCGNSSIAQDENGAGEDCDDGNKASGDGCSSNCLHEGSVEWDEIGAQCGDGTISQPYETCDDSNDNDGDGCSSSCLREGSYGSYGTCGNGLIEKHAVTGAGEDCDGEAGCDDCLYQGSSASYSKPSVCGDGVWGVGEVSTCEDSTYGATGGDGNVDPLQAALIIDSAALQVDPDTKLAQTTIKASYEDEYDTAMLYLECSAEDDSDCDSGYGPAENQCCMERPEAEPHPSGDKVCRNAAIYAYFNVEMDLDTFVYIDESGDTVSNVTIEYQTFGDCPDGYTEYSYDSSFFAKPFFAKLFKQIEKLTGLPVKAQTASTSCFVPITNITQNETSDGQYKVNFEYNILLEENADHTITITGGTYGDDNRDGVLSEYGVEMIGDSDDTFTTYDELCLLDVVEVEDTYSDSPNLFTAIDEEHEFVATPYSYQSGTKQEIQAIDDVYSWGWSSWKTDDTDESILAKSVEDTTLDASTASYTAEGENGEVDIIASATITEDTQEGTKGDTVSGTTTAVALLCENPWPSVVDFPFIDDATGTLDGTQEGVGWMNFSMYYCRDAGAQDDTSDDLPELSVQTSGSIGTEGVIKEYFFSVLDSGVETGDVIGVRIAQNTEYQSPLAWYYSQGFSGSPQEIELDGYTAIQDGRTVYATVANENGSLYPNIFVISYNQGAQTDTVLIFTQLLDTITFNTNENISSIGLCVNSSSDYSNNACESDLDCTTGSYTTCADEKAKLQRDMKRLTDVMTVAYEIDAYQSGNDGETPRLASGTYVVPLSASAWPSWNDEFATDLTATLSADPVNAYADCGSGSYEDYDKDTCVDQTKGEYVCPEGSYVYNYRAFGESGYYLTAELEYLYADWYYDIDPDTTDSEYIQIGADYSASADGFEQGPAFCDGDEYGVSTSCGDGVIGGAEVCEIGDVDYETCDSNSDGKDDGTVELTCQSDCLSYAASSSATCEVYTCGDGVKEGSEECDDGSFNGKYGYCGSLCTYDSGYYCGDGSLAGTESCDCGATTASTETSAYGGGTCAGVNGTYDTSQYKTCAWDCTGPASYCGDSEVDSAEECDTEPETWAGGFCFDGSTCTSDSDCASGACGDGGSDCGSSQICVGGESTTSQETTTTEYEDEIILSTSCSSEVSDVVTCSSYCVSETGTQIPCSSDISTGTTFETDCLASEFDDITCSTSCSLSSESAECTTQCDGEYTETEELSCETTVESLEILTVSCSAKSGTKISCDTESTTVEADSSGAEQYDYQTNCSSTEFYDISCETTCDMVDSDSGLSQVCETVCKGTNDKEETLSCETDAEISVISEAGTSTIDTSKGGSGDPCSSDSDCSSDECSSQYYDLYHYRACSSCAFGSWSSCVGGEQTCGDGIVDSNEECDDGNDDDTDSCTSECMDNICGDGYVYAGEEQCDDGENNGDVCTSSYESTCTYCSEACRTVSSSGDFCGDGVKNSDELCDDEDIVYYYFNADIGTYGTCEVAEAGQTTTDIDGNSYTCSYVGVYNGGENNGEYCTTGATCVFPDCADDCVSMCPFSYTNDSLQVKSNLVGARRSTKVTLSSYSETSSSSSLSYGNAATLYVPACTTASGFSADLSYSFDPQIVRVVFAVDLSNSMSDEALDSGETRLEVTKELLSDAISTLFDQLDSYVQVGFITMLSADATDVGTDGTPCINVASGYEDTVNVDGIWFKGESSESTLNTVINSWTTCGGTYTYSGLEATKSMMDNVSSAVDVRKIAILISDGDWTMTTTEDASRDPRFMACKLKEDGVELYTIMIDDGSTTLTSDETECDQYDGYDNWDDYYADYYEELAEEACGNGTIDSDFAEECDNGSANSNTGACTVDCKDAQCGDGYVQSGVETCDGSGETSTCDSDCTAASCGDGVENSTAGEECEVDTYDDSEPFRCTSSCEIEANCCDDCWIEDSFPDPDTCSTQCSECYEELGAEEDFETLDVYNPFAKPIQFVNAMISGFFSPLNVFAADSCTTDSSSLSIIQQMSCWSSGNPDEEEGIDYAYNGTTVSELETAFDQIIDSIFGVRFSFIIDGEEMSESIQEGSNVSLAWPEGFECDGSSEQELPIRVSFDGSGTITLSDITLNYCKP